MVKQSVFGISLSPYRYFTAPCFFATRPQCAGEGHYGDERLMQMGNGMNPFSLNMA
jgi:hypothetical protein